jgi:hypothetical protein
MLRVCSVTSRGTPDISTGLHTNMSLLCWGKLTSSPSYLGFRLFPIWTVLVGSSMSICIYLASSTALKVLDEVGMVRLVEGGGTRRHN